MQLKGYAKAIAGGLVAAATWFGTAWVDGSFDNAEVAALPLAVLAGCGLVAAVKNAD